MPVLEPEEAQTADHALVLVVGVGDERRWWDVAECDESAAEAGGRFGFHLLRLGITQRLLRRALT